MIFPGPRRVPVGLQLILIVLAGVVWVTVKSWKYMRAQSPSWTGPTLVCFLGLWFFWMKLKGAL